MTDVMPDPDDWQCFLPDEPDQYHVEHMDHQIGLGVQRPLETAGDRALAENSEFG